MRQEFEISQIGVSLIAEEMKNSRVRLSVRDELSGIEFYLGVVDSVNPHNIHFHVKTASGIDKFIDYKEYLQGGLKEGDRVVSISVDGVGISLSFIEEAVRQKVDKVFDVVDDRTKTPTQYKVVVNAYGEAYLFDRKEKQIIEIPAKDYVDEITEIKPVLYGGKYLIVKDQFGNTGVFDIDSREYLLETDYSLIKPVYRGNILKGFEYSDGISYGNISVDVEKARYQFRDNWRDTEMRFDR